MKTHLRQTIRSAGGVLALFCFFHFIKKIPRVFCRCAAGKYHACSLAVQRDSAVIIGMKKNHFFTFVGTLAIALGIVSCTNDDGNYSPNQVEPSNNTTRSVGGMTKEEVEARVDELEKKYNASILIVDTASMTESRFEEMELQMMTTQLEWQNNKDKNI